MFPHRRYKPGKPSDAGRDTMTPQQAAEADRAERLATPTADMELPVRIVNTLERNGVVTAGQLVAQTYETLTAMKNLGETTLGEIKKAVKALGLTPPAWRKPPRSRSRRRHKN